MFNNKTKEDPIRKIVVEVLTSFLAVDYSEVMDEDSFSDDLHMTPSDFTEFTAKLEEKGIDTSSVELSEIETVSDLLEAIQLNSPL